MSSSKNTTHVDESATTTPMSKTEEEEFAKKARKLDEEFISGFDERALTWLAREDHFIGVDEPAADSPGKALLPQLSRLRG